MIRDTTGVIAGMLTTWDVQECRRVSTLWRELFAVCPMSVYHKNGGVRFRRGPYKATLDRHDLTYRYDDSGSHIVGSTIILGVHKVRGYSITGVVIRSVQSFNTLVNAVGGALAELPVFMALLVTPSGDNPVRWPTDDTVVNHNGWTLKLSGCYLEVQRKADTHVLHASSYTLSVFNRAVVDTGFIMIGGRIWCADAADVAAVGALADGRRVYVHVLTSVYFCCAGVFCAVAVPAAANNAATPARGPPGQKHGKFEVGGPKSYKMSVTFSIDETPATHLKKVVDGDTASGIAMIGSVIYKYSVYSFELSTLQTGNRPIFDETTRDLVLAEWLAKFDPTMQSSKV